MFFFNFKITQDVTILLDVMNTKYFCNETDWLVDEDKKKKRWDNKWVNSEFVLVEIFSKKYNFLTAFRLIIICSVVLLAHIECLHILLCCYNFLSFGCLNVHQKNRLSYRWIMEIKWKRSEWRFFRVFVIELKKFKRIKCETKTNLPSNSCDL